MVLKSILLSLAIAVALVVLIRVWKTYALASTLADLVQFEHELSRRDVFPSRRQGGGTWGATIMGLKPIER